METKWTDGELAEFDRLTRELGNPDQRCGGGALSKFVQEHGEEKCDAMFAELTKPKGKSRAKAKGEGK